MRRLLAGAAAGLGLLLAGPVWAQDSIPASYAGSRVTTPAATSSSSFAITAQFIRSYNPGVPGTSFVANTYITVPGGLPGACGAPGEVELVPTSIRPGDKPNSTDTAATTTMPCNGAFPFRVIATLNRPLQAPDRAQLTGTIKVVAPPPNVSKVTGTVEGASVVLDWTAIPAPPPDFLGYRVERVAPGDRVMLATIPAATTAFTDTSPPAEGGEVTYQVVARRSGPSGEVVSEGTRVTVTLPVGATTTTVAGTTDGATDGGTKGDQGGTAGTGGSSSSTSTTVRARVPVPQRGRTGIGTRAPGLGTPSQSNSGLLITPDEGFDEELDYGEDGSLAGDEDDDLSSLFYEDDAGRGMAVPVATGFVLAAWAFHLRFLARAARPGRGRFI